MGPTLNVPERKESAISAERLAPLTVAVRVKKESGVPSGHEEDAMLPWLVDGNRILLLNHNHGKAANSSGNDGGNAMAFSYDHVFGTDCPNALVYDRVARQMVQRAALEGVSGTIFAYGQTSTGKTWSMQGNAADAGIVPLALQDLFYHLQSCRFLDSVKVTVSYLEIYNEVISDLLDKTNANLKILETPERGIFVNKLSEWPVTTAVEALALVMRGEEARRLGATMMNERSSRSHAILQLEIVTRRSPIATIIPPNASVPANPTTSISTSSASSDGRRGGPVIVNRARLSFVDLAGSERVGQTGAEGQRLKEGGHINKSLLALGTVVSKLADLQRAVTSNATMYPSHANSNATNAMVEDYIPYRDSKLTRILQPALDGRSLAVLLCCLSPLPQFVDESLSTLKFAQRAANVLVDRELSIQTWTIPEPKLFQAQRERDRLVSELRDYKAQFGTQCKRQRLLTERSLHGHLDTLKEELKCLLVIANHTFADVDVAHADLRKRVAFALGQQREQLLFVDRERQTLLAAQAEGATIAQAVEETVPSIYMWR